MPLQLVEGSTGEDQLMDSIDVDYTAEGWLIIDVTKAVKSWQLDYHANQGKVGCQLQCVPCTVHTVCISTLK